MSRGICLTPATLDPSADGADDWETDPDFINDVGEKDGRWGSKTVEGSGHTKDAFDLEQLRKETIESDRELKRVELEQGPKPSEGYGGRFGVQKDRVDKSAESWDYKGVTPMHPSQKDYSVGFGGQFGVQHDHQDKSAVGWNYREKLTVHESQKDYAKGFGGKYGVENSKQDKCAADWNYHEPLAQHESQKDYVKGFGGKFGLESDRQDKSAVNWQYHEPLSMHPSQKGERFLNCRQLEDYSKGFGGKYGVEQDRQDKGAVGWEYHEKPALHESQKDMSKGFGGKFGVEKDKQDKSAVGWDHHEPVAHHESQTDYSKGFGGKFGVEKEKQDKSAIGWDTPQSEKQEPSSPGAATEILTGRASSLKARFEQLVLEQEEEVKQSMSKHMAKNSPRKAKVTVPRAEERPEQPPAARVDTPVITTTAFEKVERQASPISPVNGFVESVKPAFSAVPRVPYQEPDEEECESENVDFSISGNIVNQGSPPSMFKEQQKLENIFMESDLSSQEVPAPQTNDLFQVEQEPEQQPTYDVNQSDLKGEEADVHPLSEPGHSMDDTGITAVALYDYTAGDVDEISFEPDDVITSIDMIDPGWWRGMCRGQYGLFPANYVELANK